MTTDIPSEYILVAFSNPSGLTVYRVNPDGTPAPRSTQRDRSIPASTPTRCGSASTTGQVILVARGHDAAGGKPEEPGALQVFD